MYSQISILRNHVYLAVDFGANFQELCKRLDITPQYLNNGEGHAQWQPDRDFWLHALEITRIPTLGLQMGQRPNNLNAFGMLGLLASSCRNVREAVEMICKYNDTLTGAFNFSFEANDTEGIFTFDPHPIWEQTAHESARQAVDMMMSGWTKTFHDATGKKIYPVRTELRYSQRFKDEYLTILQSPIVFNQKHNRFIFSKEYLSSPLISHDESLHTIFSMLLQQKQKKLETKHSLAERIRQIVMSKFRGQITHIDIVASQLCMTSRTLQRKLSAEKTSYRRICNDLRRELASDLMKSGKSKRQEVASLLGYSNVDAFNKAFRSAAKVNR
jgi:AraC-like DNA-binding protein